MLFKKRRCSKNDIEPQACQGFEYVNHFRSQNGYTSSRGLKQKSPLRIWRGLLIIVLACGDNGTDWLDLISNKKSYVTFQKRKVQITTETS
jgi:hypothetical protein